MRNRKPVHPGIFLYEEVIKPRELTITETAKLLKINKSSVSRLVSGELDLSISMAKKISDFTGTSIESWYQMQVNLDIYNLKNKDS